MNARYYNSYSGRFVSIDPVFWEIGLTNDGNNSLINPQLQNSYSYAVNNPIIKSDPSGRCPMCLAALVMVIPAVTQYVEFLATPIGAAIFYQGVEDYKNGDYVSAAIGVAPLPIGKLKVIKPEAKVLLKEAEQALLNGVKKSETISMVKKSTQAMINVGGREVQLSSHAVERMAERSVSNAQIVNTMKIQPFDYFHEGVSKLGYYDPVSKIFVAELKAEGVVKTVMTNVNMNYINNLKALPVIK